MDIIKRLLLVIASPLFVVVLVVEVVVYALRWIFTGKPFPDFSLLIQLFIEN